MIRRHLLALLLAALPACAMAQQQTAQQFLEDLYNPYLKAGYQGHPYTEVHRFFSPDLARAIEDNFQEAKSFNEVPLLDGDPFVDAQEWVVTSLAISTSTSLNGDQAAAGVSFLNLGTPKALAIMLVRTPEGWRISDITSSASGSLRMLFEVP
jgi:hypothetical protein